MVDLIFGWVGPRLRPLMSVGNPPLQRTRRRIIRTPATSVPITSGSMLRRLGQFVSDIMTSSYRPNLQSGLERGLGGEDLRPRPILDKAKTCQLVARVCRHS